MEKKTLSVLVAFLLTYGAITANGSIWQLNKMIKQVTGKSAIPNYSSYGCYCGLGGKGRPLDQTDWCCHQHDCCYSKVKELRCSAFFDAYGYNYQLGKITCESKTMCERLICDCDRFFVQCLRAESKTYRKSYRFYLNIWCKGESPSCDC